MVFVPNEHLPRDIAFSATVAAGTKAKAGNMGTAKALSWRFTTVKDPAVVTTVPKDGAEGVDPGSGIKITFASPMQRDGFLDHLAISPQVTNVYTSWSVYDTQLDIYFSKDPATSYSVSLDAATPDKYGAKLGKAIRFRFTTGDLRACENIPCLLELT